MARESQGAPLPVAIHGDKPECLTAIFQENVNLVARGTEWLPEPQVDRGRKDGPLPDQTVTARDIEVMTTGAVCLLKGEAWVGNEGRGVVHRSPAPGDQPRLVLGLDWLS